jgi:tetratricopeptide (TPR) repeat protein
MYQENLELKERADSGDPRAIYDYAKALDSVNEKQADQYYRKLAEFTPEELNFIGYATLLKLVGMISYEEGNYKEAIEWYNKSMGYIKANYSEELGREIIEEITLEASYVRAVLASEKQKNQNVQ